MLRTIVILFSLILTSLPASATPADEFIGFTFPQLTTDPAAWVLPGDTVFGALYPVEREARLFLSNNGQVDSLSYDTAIAPDYMRGIKNSMMALKFKPAKAMDVKTAAVLPLKVTFSSSGRSNIATLTLPINYINGTRDRALIERTLVENGFTLPGLEHFPSYFFSVPKDSGRVEYDYSLYKVKVDKTGRMLEFVEQSTSNTKLSELFTITARYARFRPTRYKDSSYPAEFYLMARFFDDLHYPTTPWPPDSKSQQNEIYDRYRLETVLYLDSLLSPAYPVNLSGTFGFPGMSIDRDSVPTDINITSDGRLEWAVYGKNISAQSRRNLNQVLKQVRLIPAMDSTGHATGFRGQLLISCTGSNKLRITEKWLPPTESR